ncbi:MAG: DUF2849 domain-containing protein [Alphaproteobacteria bacterium]|nr:DUF2849 domain-containing protein [Alphaproteobacteria bacterium]
MAQQVISANRLGDGLVVYLASDGSWSEWISRSEIAADEAAAEAPLARAKRDEADRKVIDPYLVEVAEVDGEVRPTKYREFIRATGPSIRPDLSKQNYDPASAV